jgi:LPS-assembly lipoprotein
LRNILILLNVLILSGCGFHLRGHDLKQAGFPFKTIYLKYNALSPFIGDLQNSLELYKVKIATNSAAADLTLDIISEASDKQILAVSGAGQVREFQLNYRVSLRAYDKQMNEWLPADEITLQRSLTYDDAQVLAKEQEEGLLYRDMRSDAVQQVMRRLSRAKLRQNPADTNDIINNPAASAVDATSTLNTESNSTPAK